MRVDVFAACAGLCGLEAVEPLASGSGGALLLYPHLDQAALPQAQAPPQPYMLHAQGMRSPHRWCTVTTCL